MSTWGNQMAQQLYAADACSTCGVKRGDAKIERHHVDGNTYNNAPENIRILCVRCHMTEDGRRDALRRRIRQVQKIGADKRRKRKGVFVKCSVACCDLPVKTRGWCNAHYFRARNNNWNPGDTPVRAYGGGSR